jgi:hypothetical protein
MTEREQYRFLLGFLLGLRLGLMLAGRPDLYQRLVYGAVVA